MAAAAGPVIALERTVNDFGDVKVGDLVQTHFCLTNTGDALLVIDEIRTSCGCTKAFNSVKEVPPGQKAEITVRYNSSGLSSGRKTQSVIVRSNDQNKPETKIQIFANVVHPVAIEPTTLVLRLPRFQRRVRFPVTAKNNSQERVSLGMSEFRGALSGAALQPERVVMGPNSENRFAIEMDLVKPEAGNTLTGSVSILTDHPTANNLPVRFLIKIDQPD